MLYGVLSSMFIVRNTAIFKCGAFLILNLLRHEAPCVHCQELLVLLFVPFVHT